MNVGAITAGASAQVLAAMSAIANSQAAELAVATQLEQGLQQAAASLNPNLGQIVNLSV